MDDEPQIILEDGELSDDGIEVEYTPLERPASLLPEKRQPEACDQSDESFSNDSSDSEDGMKMKRTKLRTKMAPKGSAGRKKYDIWCSRVQEDVLTETLLGCDVTQTDRSRAIESYNYPKFNNPDRHTCKRKHSDRKNPNLRVRERKLDDDIKIIPRVILDLVTDASSSDKELSQDITNKLCEEKDDLIERVVKIIGKDKAIELFKETQRIEKDGGMLIMNAIRRRTPGGVFIFLLKRDKDVTQQQIKEIFIEEKKEQAMQSKKKQREKFKQMKARINELKDTDNLPKLLTRSELLERQASEEDGDSKKSDAEDVVTNPPPSPATDAKENSSDGNEPPAAAGRTLDTYDDLFGEDTGAAMDVF